LTLSPASEPPSVAGVVEAENKEIPGFGVKVSNNGVVAEDDVESVEDGTGAI
jgi:hypothetical protein